MKNPVIVICSLEGKCLPVLMASIEAYVPTEVDVILVQKEIKVFISDKGRLIQHRTGIGATCGESGNNSVEIVRKLGYKSFICICDDIVLTPTSYQFIMEDVERLRKGGEKVGWVVARSDFARASQNIAVITNMDMFQVDVVSPYCAYTTLDAFVPYAPISYYSDDVNSLDVAAKGYKHYVSRAYVHHVGGQTLGKNDGNHIKDSEEWVRKNRPEVL